MNETKIEIIKNNDEPKKNIIIQEQFRSTKRWNDLIEAFCMNMPLKRHWRNFRTYSDCFTASEAIEWLYRHLKTNQNFSHLSISRQNAIKVLQIFLKDKIIEDVRSAGENINFKEFQDDDRVYKFNSSNQYYLNRTTVSTTTTSITATMELSTSGSNTTKTLTTENIIENKENIETKTETAQIIKSSKKQNLNITKSITSSTDKNISNILKKYEKTSNELVVRSDNTQTSKMDLTVSIPNSNQIRSSEKESNKDSKHNKLNRVNSAIATTTTTLTASNTIATSTTTTYTTHNLKIIEIWSKTTRKMLESVIKKAVLNNNIYKISHNRLNENNLLILSNENRSSKKLDIIKYDRVSPPSTSTLKRSTDIKLNLSKLLDKKAHDVLTSVSGSNIKHNCTHINKHGVVINTESDLPSWLVKAMTTLLLWDNDTGLTDDNFPKFKDVFTEVNNYFIDLKEPLLTKDLSHLFIKILDLLITPPVSSPNRTATHNKQYRKYHKNKHTNKSEEQQILEEYDEIVRLFVTSVVCMCEYENISEQTVEKVIDILKEQMITNQMELDELNLENKCISYQLLDAILCISSDKTTNNYDLFEQVESNLIKNAKLPFMNENETMNQNNNKLDDEFDEENEYLLQNLLLASLARLENCCDECLNTYNEINNLLNIKPNEYDDYISNMNAGSVDLLTQQFETTTFLNTTTTTSVNLLQQEKLKTAYLNDILMRNENEDDLSAATTSNNQINTNSNFFSAFLDDENNMKRNKSTSKKLHRNNSFRAAIGDIQPPSKLNRIAEPIILESTANESTATTNYSYENDDRLFKMPTPKRLTRSVTNSMNSEYKNKFVDETQTSSSYNHILSSSISSATLPLSSNNKSNDEGFKFKLPFDPPPAPPPRSTSMNFNQTIIEPSPTMNKLNKKRKLVNNGCGGGGSSMGISHSSSFNFGINENSSLLNSFKSASRLNRQNTLYLYHNNNKVTPSFSLTTLNQINKHNSNFSSLKNLTQIERYDYDDENDYENNSDENTSNQYKLLSTLSLNELSSFIRSNMRASYNLNDFNNAKESMKKVDNNNSENATSKEEEEERKFKITLSTEIDSEIFYFIISAFRLCALMLPPTNKRKLHLLLRFLNKLKHNKHTAKYLLNQNENMFDDLNFIDTSNITNQSLNLSNNNSNPNNSKLLKMSLNHDLENKSNAIESVIIKSFANSIVYSDKNNDDPNDIDKDLKEQLVVKLVQILINNYTEIMRIPDDLISNIKHKINMIKLNAEPIASSTVNNSTTLCDVTSSNHSKLSSSNRYCSKISLQQYDKQKAEQSKKHLTNLLNNILTDVNMKENEKLIRLRKFKESHPLIYEEKYPTIKKALSILGINETIDNNFSQIDNSNSGSSNNTNCRDDFETIKKKVFLSNFAENLNQTTTLFSNSRGFQKLFNKKKK